MTDNTGIITQLHDRQHWNNNPVTDKALGPSPSREPNMLYLTQKVSTALSKHRSRNNSPGRSVAATWTEQHPMGVVGECNLPNSYQPPPDIKSS